jgi:hypothetical protein
MFEEVGVCSNCDKEVSDEYGAGDHCPHCGVFFEYQEDEYGQKTMAPNNASNRSGSNDFRITGRGVRGLIKLAIFGVLGVASLCGWLCRKMFSS